jgi:hypothetical protein
MSKKLSHPDKEIFLGEIDPKIRAFLSNLREQQIISAFPAEVDVKRLSKKISEILIGYWNEDSGDKSEDFE